MRVISTIALLLLGSAIVLPATPAGAITAKQKMETCKFGADAEKYTGKKRSDFIKRCMAKESTPAKKAVKKKTAKKVQKKTVQPTVPPPPIDQKK